MSQLKRKQGFVTPFSRSGCSILKHGSEQTKRLPLSKEDSRILSPVHLGRHVQIITPQTRQEIKRRFACGFSRVSSNDTSPGIYVPFELSQASCYSQDSVEEKTNLEADGETEMRKPPSEEQLPVGQTKPHSEDDSDVELVQDADTESITSDASAKVANDDSEWTKHADHTTKGLDAQHIDEKDESMQEHRFERKHNQKDGSNIHRENVERMNVNKVDGDLNCTFSTLTKKNASQNQRRCEISKTKPFGLIRPADKRKQRSHKPTGDQERSSGKTDDNRASSILRKSRHGNVRREKRRSFEMMKQEVLRTLKKMHREIQELLERKKMLSISVNGSGDEMTTGPPNPHTTSKKTGNDIVQEE